MRELSIVLRDAEAKRYLVHIWAASRVREALGSPQTQSDPEGGHPVRVAGGIWRLETGLIGVADCWCISRVFPSDVVYRFNCFVGGNYLAKPWSGPAMQLVP